MHWRSAGRHAFQVTGDPERTCESGRDVLDWVHEAQERGAGEIVLNCMGSDGVRRGYDIEQLRAVRTVCHVPLVASGGAGAHRGAVLRTVAADDRAHAGQRVLGVGRAAAVVGAGGRVPAVTSRMIVHRQRSLLPQ